ncbi:MFS transporter [Xylanimonas protaetiae]|nr:MFS transporter [Xylanimonas protaetiae]
MSTILDAAAPTKLRHNRPYLLLMSGKTTQLVGAGIGAFAVPLIAFQVTGSVARAGLVAAVGEVGALLAALPAGVVADRVDRRRLIIGAALVGAVLWASVAVAGVLGHLTAAHLAAVLFAASLVTALEGPAESGALRAVVTPEQMPTAMAAVQGRSAVATLAAAPLGGLLYGFTRFLPVAAAAVAHVAVAVCTAFVRVPLSADVATERETHPVEALREGLRFVWSRSFFRVALLLSPLINLTVNGLLVAVNLDLVRQHTEPLLIALIDTVAGAAMLGGAVLAPAVLRRVRVGTVLVAALAWIAVCFVAMAALHTYTAYVVLTALAVLPLGPANAGTSGYVAAVTPPRLQGRLASVMSLSYLLSAPLTPALAGGLLAATGLQVTLWVFAGVLAVAVAAFAATRAAAGIGTPDTWAADALPDDAEA